MEVDADVRRFVDAVTPERRRRDAETLLELMQRVTGQPARLQGVGSHESDLRLGPHTTGAGCVYIKDLAAVDLEVLESIVARSYRTPASGTCGLRAREGKEE